jgi:hypothetical protein
MIFKVKKVTQNKKYLTILIKKTKETLNKENLVVGMGTIFEWI